MGNTKVKWPSIEYAQRVSSYFSHHATNEPLFKPELEISKKVLNLMKVKPQSDINLARIAKLLMEIEELEHYDGSGWHDFKTCIVAWIEEQRNDL